MSWSVLDLRSIKPDTYVEIDAHTFPTTQCVSSLDLWYVGRSRHDRYHKCIILPNWHVAYSEIIYNVRFRCALIAPYDVRQIQQLSVSL